MTHATNRHMHYVNNLAIWKRCRDARAGEDAIKKGGTTYLPQLGGQNNDDYDSYKARARFFNAFNKTINGHVGLATRKPILIEQPESFEPLTDNIDRNGSDVTAYIKSLLTELLEVGRVATLIDYTNLGSSATMADAIGARPYWVQYKAEDFLDWEYHEGVLVYAVFRELIEKRGSGNTQTYRYRVCEIVDGVYQQQVFDEESKAVAAEPIIPKINNQTLNFIPVVVHQTDYDSSVDLPPLLDLVNLCISHYRLKADHAHALHYVAMPTPWVTGVDIGEEGEEGESNSEVPTTIGPQKIWAFSNPETKVGMLEFTGQGVEAIEKELKSMEDQMAIIGARILLPEVSENTATATTIRSISETSDLASIVTTLERQLNMMLEFTSNWAGITAEVEARMDKQFLPVPLDGAMLTALVASWQNSAFDYDTLVENLKRAEIVDPKTTIDDLKKATSQEADDRIAAAAAAIAATTIPKEEEENEEEENEEEAEE